MNIYGVYDLKDKEQYLMVGTLIEIIKFLNATTRSIDRAINKHDLIKQRYEVHYLFKEETYEIR